MRKVLQNVRDGRLSVASIPAPTVGPGEVLIANARSVVSAGTERAARELASMSLLGKARKRPDQVRRVVEKIRNEGLVSTLRQVRDKLDEPMPMGYSSAGIVIECGENVQSFKPGDRVASNGPHAEVAAVPELLCAPVPDGVSFDQAAFGVLGAIALQGVRLSKVSLGETTFVVGLGLIGQLTVQLLTAAGCRVLATDPDPAKCELALRFGAHVARTSLSAEAVASETRGLGADSVLITASTESNGPIELAANAVRKKGRIVLVGVVGLHLDRRPFFFKEAEFVVSCSYGPGRYDPNYEARGHDYPAAYVRWTEQRNIHAVLQMMAAGRVDVAPLVTHRFAIADAERAYRLIESSEEPYLGILLEYAESNEPAPDRKIVLGGGKREGAVGVGILGAGNFARSTLIPAVMSRPEFRPVVLCSAGGASATNSGGKHGFAAVTSDEDEVFRDPSVRAVLAVTRHDQHARQVVKAIRARKHVFVEKPLCLTLEELHEIETTLAESGDAAPLVMVGFNRRFSPAAVRLKQFFGAAAAPLTISIRFNAGIIPPDHWTQDPAQGGRIIGEACHGIDLATYLAGSPPVRVYAESVGGPHAPPVTDDQCFITLRHANGNISNIAYLAGGDRSFPKERVEVIGGGRIGIIDDFRSVTLVARGRTERLKLRGQDKGHQAEIAAFAEAVAGGRTAPISWTDLRAVSLASILAVRSLREGYPVIVPSESEPVLDDEGEPSLA